jgi:hypothetical protein
MKTDIADKLIIKGLLARGYPITGIADKLKMPRSRAVKLMLTDKEYPSLKLLSRVNGNNAVQECWPDIVYMLERNASIYAVAEKLSLRYSDLKEHLMKTKYRERLQLNSTFSIRLKKDVKELLLGQSLTRGYSSLGGYITAILTKQARA